MYVLYALIAGYLIYDYSIRAISKINYTLLRVKNINWGINSVAFQLELEIDNNSPVPLSIDGFRGSIWKTVKIADLELLTKIKIPNSESGIIILGAKVDYSGLAGAVANFFESGKNSTVEVRGDIYTSAGNIPVKFKTSLW